MRFARTVRLTCVVRRRAAGWHSCGTGYWVHRRLVGSTINLGLCCRWRYPSVTNFHLLRRKPHEGPTSVRRGFINFSKQEERDSAITEASGCPHWANPMLDQLGMVPLSDALAQCALQMNGLHIDGFEMRVELPLEEQLPSTAQRPAMAPPPGMAQPPPAATGAAASSPPTAPAQFKLAVANVGTALNADELAGYFRCVGCSLSTLCGTSVPTVPPSTAVCVKAHPSAVHCLHAAAARSSRAMLSAGSATPAWCRPRCAVAWATCALPAMPSGGAPSWKWRATCCRAAARLARACR